MDVTPTAAVTAALDMQAAADSQHVQVAVLKKTLDTQAQAALTLLQAVPGPLPLATSGHLGTQFNRMV